MPSVTRVFFYRLSCVQSIYQSPPLHVFFGVSLGTISQTLGNTVSLVEKLWFRLSVDEKLQDFCGEIAFK